MFHRSHTVLYVYVYCTPQLSTPVEMSQGHRNWYGSAGCIPVQWRVSTDCWSNVVLTAQWPILAVWKHLICCSLTDEVSLIRCWTLGLQFASKANR